VEPHAFHPEAAEEYAEAAAYYAEQGGRSLGGRFYDEIQRVVAEIKASPRHER
jgi:hypothetical protein